MRATQETISTTFGRHGILLCVVLVLLALCVGCSSGYDGQTEHGMYYWSTTFDIDSVKQEFMNLHDVNRLYVRYFDVTLDANGQPVPNATIAFEDSTGVPANIEIVPVVFILNDCMGDKSQMSVTELANKLLARVLQMSETHSLGKVREIQVDCDWTGSTRKRYYDFLTELHRLCQSKGIQLSATIRLHQLSQPVPPVDKGILMVYNTGDMTDIMEEKPILDVQVVKKYARYLRGYKLPMGAAYPIYKWDLLFRNGKFVDISHYDGELPMMSGDTLVTREVSSQDIIDAKSIIEAVRPDIRCETILFDLSRYNIIRYSDEEFESFFN